MENDSGRHEEEHVQSVLRDNGFHIEPIPRDRGNPPKKTPDFWVRTQEGDVLVEVKLRKDDEQFRNLLKAPEGTPLLYYSRTATENCLRKGLCQILEFSGRKDSCFTVIWFRTRRPGGITALTAQSAKSFLYGTERLEGHKVDGKAYGEECYFFHESFFRTSTDLDGVILEEAYTSTLCLNPYSPRYRAFKDTTFVGLFRVLSSNEAPILFNLSLGKDGIVDPEEMESAGDCFIADCSITREGWNGIERHLKDKYGLKTVKITRYVLHNSPDVSAWGDCCGQQHS